MAETELTKEIKKALLYYAKADQAGVYGCYEVCLGAGYGDEYVDFMTMNSKNEFKSYEIKVSLSDMKSKAKLSFCGNYNYLVLPTELLYNPSAKEEIYRHISHGIGILGYNPENAKIIELKKSGHMTLNIGRKVELMHYMIRSSLSLSRKSFLTRLWSSARMTASLSVPPLSQEPLSRLRFSRTARLRKSPSSPTSPRRTRSASSVTDSPTPRWKFPLSTLNQ